MVSAAAVIECLTAVSSVPLRSGGALRQRGRVWGVCVEEVKIAEDAIASKSILRVGSHVPVNLDLLDVDSNSRVSLGAVLSSIPFTVGQGNELYRERETSASERGRNAVQGDGRLWSDKSKSKQSTPCTTAWYCVQTALPHYVVRGFFSLAHPLSHVSLPLSSPPILSVPLFHLFLLHFCRKDAIVEIVARTEKRVYP